MSFLTPKNDPILALIMGIGLSLVALATFNSMPVTSELGGLLMFPGMVSMAFLSGLLTGHPHGTAWGNGLFAATLGNIAIYGGFSLLVIKIVRRIYQNA